MSIENFIAAATEGGIEAQEAAGQRSFVSSETLPRICPREELESLGFVFGEVADDIFIYVEFPEGWKKVPTTHSMWSDLVDDKGAKRGSLFYKAAFYDISAHMYLTLRYSCRQNFDLEDAVEYNVFDKEEIIFSTPRIGAQRNSNEYWKIQDEAEKQAKEYLEQNYPDYKNPLAYWE